MSVSVKNSRKTTQSPPKRGVEKKQSKRVSSKDFSQTYQRYFTPPANTPDTFRIFDLTEGVGISYSSHT
jgi:hypothetical protein